uniref:Uncharacterized protein n=1 Tax=Zea mays TaxID=4577 RepID=A0A804Q4V5_MAIZE
MLGRTPPWAMVTPDSSLPSSSSLRMARSTWRGMMRVFLLSLAALPASSSTSAARYRPMRPTGNCSPALTDLVTDFFLGPPALRPAAPFFAFPPAPAALASMAA